MQNRINTLADFIGVNENAIKADDWQENAFINVLDDSRYFVFTDNEADKSAAEMIKESLWAFNADFILNCCGLETTNSVIFSLRSMQAESCEDCNALILALINGTCGFDSFVEKAINADGRGHFISGYDGIEEENNGYYIYRID